MAEKSKKIDKEYLLTDDSVNCYGFRLLTAGYQIDEYKKNPIGFNMHLRDQGVTVKWDDLRVDGDQVYGKPCINLSNPKGQQTVDEIESGFLNAASMGHFVVLEISDDPTLKLPNQTGPTVTKWYNRECSLVDIPGNFNALKLFDKDENEINLADFAPQTPKGAYNKIFMKQIILTAEQLGKINLKADTVDAAAFETAFNDLVAKAAKVDGLTNDLAAANTAKTTAEDALTALKDSTAKSEVERICADGLAAKKGTKELFDMLKVSYAADPTGLKALVDKLPAFTSITTTINSNNQETVDLSAKSWTELDKAGKLEDLKAKNIDLFKAKYKEQFGTEYKG